MIRAVTYAISSSEIKNEKFIADQQRNCHEYANTHGLVVIKDYKDLAEQIDRPNKNQLIKDANAGCFDVIIIDHLDRLSRDVNFFNELNLCGIRLIAVSDGIDSNSKETSSLKSRLLFYINNHMKY